MNRSTWRKLYSLALWALMALLAAAPLLLRPVRYGNDVTFHLNRILFLAQSLEQGVWHPYIYNGMNYGYGYGTPLFYSDFFLLLPAALVRLGMPVVNAYRLLIWLCLTLSAYAMDRLLQKLHLRFWPRFLAVTAFLFSCYRYSTALDRGGIGEVLALVFVPVLFQSIVEMIQDQPVRPAPLIIGLCGLLLSHNITFVLTLILFVIFAVIYVVRMLRQKKYRRIGRLILSCLSAMALTAFYFCPMLEQLSEGVYRVSHYFDDGEVLESTAIQVTSLLDFFTTNATLGPDLVLLPIGNLFHPRADRTAFVMSLSGYVLLFMTTVLFPWHLFSFFSFMQWPHRLLDVALVPLTIGAGFTLQRLLQKKRSAVLAAALTVLSVFTPVRMILAENDGFFTSETTAEDLRNNLYVDASSTQWYDIMQLGTPDYLTYDTNYNYVTETYGVLYTAAGQEDGTLLEATDQLDGTLDAVYQGAGTYRLPRSYYKGYAVQVLDADGNILTQISCAMDPVTGLCQVQLEQIDQAAAIRAFYVGTVIQHVSRLLSGFSLILLLVFCLGNRIRKRKSRRSATQETHSASLPTASPAQP